VTVAARSNTKAPPTTRAAVSQLNRMPTRSADIARERAASSTSIYKHFKPNRNGLARRRLLDRDTFVSE